MKRGFQRLMDTHAGSQINDLESLVSDKELFDYYFSNMKYYSVTEASERFKHEWLSCHCSKGKTLLDFVRNAGNGIYGALAGAEVFGIDISLGGHRKLKKKCAKNGCRRAVSTWKLWTGKRCCSMIIFLDVAVEYGALASCGSRRRSRRIGEASKPDAKMIRIEALRHNPLIHAYRKRTQYLRTE